MRYTVELTDDDGKSCTVNLSIPFDVAGTGTDNSTWRVANEGSIKFRSGGCEVAGGRFEELTLRLVRGTHYGVSLYSFTSKLIRTINSSGEGNIHQSWCLSFKPGHISWVLVE
jgi:hypothetical protein